MSYQNEWASYCSGIERDRESDFKNGRCGLCVNCVVPNLQERTELGLSENIGFCHSIEGFVGTDWSPADMGCEEVYEVGR